MDALTPSSTNRGTLCEPCQKLPHKSIPTYKRQNSKNVAARALPPLQEVLVGGAVVSAVGAALGLSLKAEATVCDGCGGNGGVVCFACSGTGTMSQVSLDEMVAANQKRDPLGRQIDSRECKACKGCGRLLCKRCNGSGYA